MGKARDYILGSIQQFIRFVVIIGILAAILYGIHYAWKNFIQKTQKSTERARTGYDKKVEDRTK